MWFSLLPAVAVVIGIFALWLLAKHLNSQAGAIAGPAPLPVLGNLLNYIAVGDQHMLLIEEWHKRYGTLFQCFLPGFPSCQRLVFTTDPAVIKHFLATNFQSKYEKGDYQKDMYRDLLGKGIFNVSGDAWRVQRKHATPFFSVKRLREHCAVFQRRAINAVECAIKRQKSNGSSDVDLQDLFLCYTLDSFAEIGFGVDLGTLESGSSAFQIAFDYVQTQSEARGRLGEFWKVIELFWRDRRFQDELDYMDEFVQAIITERRAESNAELEQREDLLTSLILEGSKVEGFSDRELRDYTMNFLIAGRDTTAMLLTWTCYRLASNPDIMRRVRQEMAEVLGSCFTDADVPVEVSWQQQKDLVYLKRVLQETLRLHPPVPLEGFQAYADDTLPDGTAIKKGDLLSYSAYCVHRDPSLWASPELFDPERFNEAPTPFSFLPFHGGPRICLGQEMAYIEAKVMLCHFLKAYDLAVARPVQMRARIILTAKDGMHCRLTERLGSVAVTASA